MFRRTTGATTTGTDKRTDGEDHEGGQTVARGVSAGAAMHAAGKLTRTGPTREPDAE